MMIDKIYANLISDERPWGRFERFTLNQPSTVKLVYIEAGKRLSLQYHNKRTEFWKVVKGPVEVRIKDKVRILQSGETTVIPEQAVHRLVGLPNVKEAIVLEISYGEFDEADIVRLDDDYHRVTENTASITL
jgi:mannose-1-phosphate guanylyltransferase